MKVMIKHACGCEKENVISGQIKGREYRITRLEERKCYNCWTREQAEKETGKVEIVEMHYSEYKNGDYIAVPDSYDKKTKTIKVYVPVQNEADHTPETEEDVIEEIKEDIVNKLDGDKVVLTTDDAAKYNKIITEKSEKLGFDKKDMASKLSRMMTQNFNISKDKATGSLILTKKEI